MPEGTSENQEISTIEEEETCIKWLKYGRDNRMSIVGKETLVRGAGCQLSFLDPVALKLQRYRANTAAADGVRCVTGHRTLPLVGFAELALTSCIFVLSYPDFKILATFSDPTVTSYIAISFGEMELLVTLSGAPSFKVTVWRWRTGEILANAASGMDFTDQLLKCSQTTPLCVTQTSPSSSMMLVWEAHSCFKRCLITRHEIDFPSTASWPCEAVWSSDGSLFAVDAGANVYLIEENRVARLAVPWTGGLGTHATSGVWYKGGIVVAGPDSVVKMMRRGPRGWSELWSFAPDLPVGQLISLSAKELLVGVSHDKATCHTAILMWNQDVSNARFDTILETQTNFEEICPVLPLAEIFVARHNTDNISIWDIETGTLLTTIQAREGESISIMRSNPAAPIIAIGRPNGGVELLSMFVPTAPSTIFSLVFAELNIDSLEFSSSGCVLVAASLDTGNMYFIKVQPGLRIEVVAHHSFGIPLASWTLNELEHELQVLVLLRTVGCCHAGETLSTLVLTLGSWGLRAQATAKLPGCYTQLISTGLAKRLWLGVPHRSRQLHTIKLGPPGMPLTKSVIETRPSAHQLRRYTVAVQLGVVVTYGMDGLIVVRRAETREAVLVESPQHRMNGGVRSAFLTPSGQTLLSLGRDGSVVCINIRTPVVSGEKVIVRSTPDADWIKLLTSAPASGNITHGKTWVEMQAEKKLIQETAQFSATRRALLKELTDIKAKTVELLENNFTCPDEERLEIREFDLDITGRVEATREAAEARASYETHALAMSAARDAMAEKVKQLCWETMEVKGRCIKAMLGNFEVENFALLPPDVEMENQIAKLSETRKVEQALNKLDQFCPWLPVPSSTLVESLRESPLKNEGDTDDLRLTLLADDVEDVHSEPSEPEEPDEAWNGASSYQFVELSPLLTSQIAVATYGQVCDQVLLTKQTAMDLRLFFNKQFNEMMAMKEREMASVAERHERLRYILSELKNTSMQVLDPTWYPHERPETIVTVEDKEVIAAPYVTPAEQARRDKLAAEAEARRLAELADNFRERALIEMMDGVLEVRWEDIIKKDIPIPKCMIDRVPEDWTEEDLRIVHDYEEKVAHLMSERERYKNMLEAEFQKLARTVWESMRRFDQKLADLHSLRLRVQAAVCQEDLKILRWQLHCQNRIKLDREEEEAIKDIADHEVRLEALRAELVSLQATTAEGRAAYEALQAKDRLLEKNFRKDFADVTQLIMDLLLKAYKRRPKGQGPRGQNAPSMLVETARCVTTQDRSICLPPDCTDFLRGVNNMDVSSAIPAALPDEHWPALCRARRLRIDNELRIKACALEMAEADATVSVYQKRLAVAKEFAVTLAQRLQALRDKKIEMATNIEIQLVMKQGLVEIPLTGRLVDYEDAVLIKRYNIEAVNKDIRSAGKKKLKAMTETMKFRRGIICMEWEHKSLKMEIEDLTDSLRSIELFKVSKEIQDILRRRFKGMPEEKGSITATLEKEMMNLRKYYERVFRELSGEMADVERQIEEKTRENRRLDKAIVELNVAVNEQHLRRDLIFEEHEVHAREERIAAIMQRSRLCTQIQKQHGDILLLQTELELLRLKTYPTLTYHTLS